MSITEIYDGGESISMDAIIFNSIMHEHEEH